MAQQSLGPYRLLGIVKTGQTSQVWAAIRDSDQMRVAIKTLLADYRRDREHVGYLKHEFEVGRVLEHPRVIRIYDFGFDQRTPYLAMEYFAYPNMKDIIHQVREEIAFMMPEIVSRAAAGLAYLNEHGWIHRDVKPDNFLVNMDGDVKLIDFALAQKKKTGLAALFGGRGKVQGTRSYMSPEQIRGKALDLRSDVYSFGCTIFHLVSGRPPYTGTNSNELLNKHLKSQIPSLDTYNRNITPEFAELIRSTMAKSPDKRPKTMSDVFKALASTSMFKKPPPRPEGAGHKENAA